LRRRRSVALIALTAVIIGGFGPVVVTTWLAFWLTERSIQDSLEIYAAIPVVRTEKALIESKEVLTSVDGMTGCGPDHITAMRNQVMQSRYVDEVGYFENGVLACTSWGIAPPGIEENTVNFTTATGLGVRAAMTPGMTESGHVMAVHLGAHNVLIKHLRIIDVLNLEEVSVALAYMPLDGPPLLMASGNDALRDVLMSGVSKTSGLIPGSHISAPFRRGEFVGEAAMPNSLSHRRLLLGYLARLVPIGLIMAIIIVFNVIWLCLRRLDLKHEVQAALRAGELRLVYQPLVELESGRCVGAEALIRWQQRDGSFISPDIFIPVAEDSDLIGKISSFAIQRACDDLGDLLRRHPEAHVSMNLSAYDVIHGDIAGTLRDTLAAARLPSRSVWLEITERSLIAPETSRSTLADLRRAGHCIAIDDFGTGYSSLQYLQNLSLDMLKIDKSFVDVIGKQTVNQSVIETIIELATSLKLNIVAEGIETQEQLEFLRQRGVRFGQGYLIARPMEVAEFVAFYAQWKDGAPREVAWAAE
jgi:sensor c-di-GMP phosphodiesterase-like protein